MKNKKENWKKKRKKGRKWEGKRQEEKEKWPKRWWWQDRRGGGRWPRSAVWRKTSSLFLFCFFLFFFTYLFFIECVPSPWKAYICFDRLSVVCISFRGEKRKMRWEKKRRWWQRADAHDNTPRMKKTTTAVFSLMISFPLCRCLTFLSYSFPLSMLAV